MYLLDGGTSGIGSVESLEISGESKVYTPQGIRVNAKNLQRGFYIVNGKKVLVK